MRNRLSIFCWRLFLLLAGALLIFFCLPPGAPRQPLTTWVLSDEGEVIAALYKEHRELAVLQEIPDFLCRAVLAVEDHRFYEHSGFSPVSFFRALYHNLFIRRGLQGGSTITQQLAKTGYLYAERSLVRKAKEVIYAFRLELHYTKEQILEMYINQIYFGHGAYGVKTAAKTYFGRELAELNRAEMALLAGLPKGPALYSPYLDRQAAADRIKVVLQRMESAGYLTAGEREEILKEGLRLPGPARQPKQARYFLDFALEEAARILRVDRERLSTMGLTIETSLSLSCQQAAEKALRSGLAPYQKDGQPQGALIAASPRTGAIKALTGGTSYTQTSFNRATQARRQPGSAFKPFIYLAALEAGYTLASSIPCQPFTWESPTGVYEPVDYGEEPYHHRELSLREALAVSCNIAAVSLHHELKMTPVITMARRLGITSPLPSHVSLALGTAEITPLELLTAYLPLANGGRAVTPWTVKAVYDRSGRLLWQRRPHSRQVLDPRLAFLVTSALQDTLKPGGTAAAAGRKLQHRHPAAGKTGTTQGNRDAWFAGYTPQLAAVVYIGHDRNQPLPGGGGKLAAPVWVDFINQALAGEPTAGFPVPPGIVSRSICRETGLLATPACPQKKEYFRVGYDPVLYCAKHRLLKLQVCRTSGLLPGPYCRGTEEKEFSWGEQPRSQCHLCRPPLTFWELLFRNDHPQSDPPAAAE
jgi:1A family penicillin-binding protein